MQELLSLKHEIIILNPGAIIWNSILLNLTKMCSIYSQNPIIKDTERGIEKGVYYLEFRDNERAFLMRYPY